MNLETRWDKRGCRAGLWIGFIGSALIFLLADLTRGPRLFQVLMGLVCVAPFAALFGGLLGIIAGMWVAFAVRICKGREAGSGRALEVALDEYDEVTRRWGEAPIEQDPGEEGATDPEQNSPPFTPNPIDHGIQRQDLRHPPG